jgi:hypothetical protein
MKRLILAAALAVSFFTLLLRGAPALSAAPGPWWADYFANPHLAGTPALSRLDSAINFHWASDSPDHELPSDNFSVRWSRDEWFAGGTYRFSARTDDGVRIWLEGNLVLDEWHDRGAVWTWVDRYVPEGVHTVVVEYYERVGVAVAEVTWTKVTGGAMWQAEYYDNRDLEGDPVLTQDVGAIDFDWGAASPDAVVPADDFSVRWTRVLGFTAGTYRFLASCDDGVRIWVDDQLVVDAWQKQELPNTRVGEVVLGEGQHTVVVEYFEKGGVAAAHVWWDRLEAVSGWQGCYYDNPDLVGGPSLERDDAEIGFDWGLGPPVDWMPDDNFSARWTQAVVFTPGYYIFKAQSDDGVRFWLDGNLLINEWRQMEAELRYLDGVYLEGPHELVVEYFERTGHARIHFWWERSALYAIVPDVVEPVDDPWVVEFFANPSLKGAPALTRIDRALDYDWGLGMPALGLPRDGFSVRWTQPLYFDAGTYRFVATTDDGVRLWVDGQLLIDAWRPLRASHFATVRLERGMHDVRMEYFERVGAALARLTWERIDQTSGRQAVRPSTTSSWQHALEALERLR